ncbi:hypothetical protein GCM10022252_45890 [Streptosporangium oxazolinicum]|uniref:Uncharacterized protein n=1 Tax=Streptosporangium oxazolinicum TaxID=909287 RepID=A0ABP8B3U9_9ACTN
MRRGRADRRTRRRNPRARTPVLPAFPPSRRPGVPGVPGVPDVPDVPGVPVGPARLRLAYLRVKEAGGVSQSKAACGAPVPCGTRSGPDALGRTSKSKIAVGR